MNDDRRFERDVASVFAGMAPSQGPQDLLDDVFLTTGRMRPRPRWLALIKEPPMRYSSSLAVGSPTVRLVTIAALTLVLLMASLAAVGIGARVFAADAKVAPFGPARNGPLLYSAGGDIYLADADSGDPRPIIAGVTLDQVPWFSHDGTKIAFGRGSEIARYLMIADADGSNVTKILGPGDWWAEFLPGDEQMVVTQLVDGKVQMSIVDVATGATVQVLDLETIESDWWVMPRPPDGHELIFKGHPAGSTSDAGLYAIGPDGSGLHTIGAISETESEFQSSFLDSSISPDGSTVLYWNWEPAGGAGTKSGAYMHLRDLETGEELPVPFDGRGQWPIFSPDGKSILYWGATDDGATPQHIVLAPVDGSQPAAPVGPSSSGANVQGFGFSPDGTKVFLVQTGATTLIDLATGDTTDLGDAGGPEASGWQRLAP